MRSKRRRTRKRKVENPLAAALLRLLVRNIDRGMLGLVVLIFFWVIVTRLSEDSQQIKIDSIAAVEAARNRWDTTPPKEILPTSESMRVQAFFTPNPRKIQAEEARLDELMHTNPYRYWKPSEGENYRTRP